MIYDTRTSVETVNEADNGGLTMAAFFQKTNLNG